MNWRVLPIFAFLTLLRAGAAFAADIEPGGYVCTVEKRAGIASVHLEDAGPPRTFADDRAATRFAIQVTRQSSTGRTAQFHVVEAPYSGPDRDRIEWHTQNSVLHSAYLGDGAELAASEEQAFLRFGSYNPFTGRVWFYHAGIEYPGGEDTNLTVRHGTSARQSSQRSP